MHDLPPASFLALLAASCGELKVEFPSEEADTGSEEGAGAEVRDSADEETSDTEDSAASEDEFGEYTRFWGELNYVVQVDGVTTCRMLWNTTGTPLAISEFCEDCLWAFTLTEHFDHGEGDCAAGEDFDFRWGLMDSYVHGYGGPYPVAVYYSADYHSWYLDSYAWWDEEAGFVAWAWEKEYSSYGEVWYYQNGYVNP